MMKLEQVALDLMPAFETSIQAVKPITKKRNVVIQLDSMRRSTQIIGDQGTGTGVCLT